MDWRTPGTEDIPGIMTIIEDARKHLKKQGVDQWQDGFPAEEDIRRDLAQNRCLLILEEGRPAAFAALSLEPEPCYERIEGAWLLPDGPYGTIHRVAVSSDFRGRGLSHRIFALCDALCREAGMKSVRVDTHEDNATMRRVIEKNGFSHCGRVCYEKNGARIAFEKILTDIGGSKMDNLAPNQGKNEVIEVNGKRYARLPIKTHVVTDKDQIPDVAEKYVKPYLMPGDIVFMSEKSVACSQKRAIPLDTIKPRRLARFLTRFVYKSPYGIGLSMPETMEMALRECGVPRILLAAFVSAVGKLIGVRGWFYKVAGYKAESIDGPTPYTLPPYNKCVVLGPEDPDKVARETSQRIGVPVCVVDINDLQGRVLGASSSDIDRALIAAVLKDNPLGQSGQQTPMGIIRPRE